MVTCLSVHCQKFKERLNWYLKLQASSPPKLDINLKVSGVGGRHGGVEKAHTSLPRIVLSGILEFSQCS